MDFKPVYDAKLVSTPLACESSGVTDRWPLGKRMLVAFAVGTALSVAGVGVWMFGILMLTFSLDGASSNQLPDWLEPLMLVGWPVSIGMAAVLPALLIARGVHWNRILLTVVVSVSIAIAVYLTGFVSVIASST